MILTSRSRTWGGLLLLFLLLTGSRAAALEGKVEWVYDGDTLRVAGVGKVRLLGIDVPERQATERDRFLLRQGISEPRLRQIAERALRFSIKQAKGNTVRLVFDGERRDRHGRLLAYVYLPDGRLLNRTLLEQGYAVVYRRFAFERKEEFLAAEKEARRRKAGLWGK